MAFSPGSLVWAGAAGCQHEGQHCKRSFSARDTSIARTPGRNLDGVRSAIPLWSGVLAGTAITPVTALGSPVTGLLRSILRCVKGSFWPRQMPLMRCPGSSYPPGGFRPACTPSGRFKAPLTSSSRRRFMTDTEWWRDRASARTPDEREQRYAEWLRRTETADTPERRSLFMRRYQRPKAPEL